MSLRAVAFDLDGVLSDTQKIMSLAESLTLRKFGINLSPREIEERYIGTTDEFMFSKIIEEYSLNATVNDLIKTKWSIVPEYLHLVEPIHGSSELVSDLVNHNTPLAVVSSSPGDYVRGVLERLGILEHFRVIITSENVKVGKPDPEPYAKASSLLGMDAGDCVAIEDAFNGIISAKRAGMKAVLYSKDGHAYEKADLVVKSLADLNYERLAKLWR